MKRKKPPLFIFGGLAHPALLKAERNPMYTLHMHTPHATAATVATAAITAARKPKQPGGKEKEECARVEARDREDEWEGSSLKEEAQGKNAGA